jgi:hypothetical protein
MQKYLFGAICLMLILACGKTDKNAIPPDVMNKEQMENILYDMHLAEGIVGYQSSGLDSNARKVLGYYEQIYKKNNLTKEQFIHSYDFYIQHPVMLDSIYSNIITKLSEQESLLRK